MLTNNDLDKLADDIKTCLSRLEKNAAEWTEDAITLCIELAEARSRLPDNTEFGQWWDVQGFTINRNDRAAAIEMGQQPLLARQVFERTTRRSLQHIFRYEFSSLHHVMKTPASVTKPKRISAKQKRAFDAYDRRKDVGEKLTQNAVAAEAGVSLSPVRTVFATREAEEAAGADGDFGLDLDTRITAYSAALSPTLRKKFDANIAAYRRELASKFEETCRRDRQRWQDETGISFFMKRLDDLEQMLTWPRNSVMTKGEYNIIMRCLHPDTGFSRTTEERAEGFRLFTHYKLKMINDEEERERARRELRSGMPKTLAEMLERRKRKTA